MAIKRDIPFIYDIEDYDPGIYVPEAGKHYKSCTEFLLKKCAPSASALTSASPLIGEYSLKLIGDHPNHQVILNSFPSTEFSLANSHKPIAGSTGVLRLVWFSQTISFGRGLEQLFEALNQLNELTTQQLIITLIGNMDPEFEKQIVQTFQSQISNLTSQISLLIKPPLSQPELHAELAHHDIGLALEPGKDLNNGLAISNKIIAYAQAGLCILATDTPAQKQFMQEHPDLGTVCGQDKEGIVKGIAAMLEATNKINTDKLDRFKKGKELAWEKESSKLVEIWKRVLIT
ncbi:hypothetical protein [Saccharicrinis sp. 156]|uniref:hypothetical protein n=1 Tax=Saccharicrinis sp. 156 TaxID=3417574 RepID=UPI003D357BFA